MLCWWSAASRWLRDSEDGARPQEAADGTDRADGDLDEFDPHFKGVVGDAGYVDDLPRGFDDDVTESEAEAEAFAQNEWGGALDFQAEFAQIQRYTQSFEGVSRTGGKGCVDDEIAGFDPSGHAPILWEFPVHGHFIVQLSDALDVGCRSMAGSVRRLC